MHERNFPTTCKPLLGPPLQRQRNWETQKGIFLFIVDNGPQEKPSSPLVQMCMARLMGLLKLHKISQLSFAEYHSKRNFVERVHSEENRVLSKHGPFNSHAIHQIAEIGSSTHKENMEHMAGEVCKCISTGRFGGKSMKCYRGIEPKHFLFDDEDRLNTFLSLSEEGKGEFADTYKVKNGDLLTQLHVAWDVDLHFEGRYQSDYRLISNELTVERTAWKDKYSTVLYSPGNIHCRRRELQPIPDIIRWLNCHELHYMPWQEATLLEDGPWYSIEGLFLPSKVLDLFFIVIPKPPKDIDEEMDQATLVYSSEPGCTYTIDLSTYINQKKIQLVRAIV